MKENNEWNGFSLFNDVEDKVLRSYNRCVMMSNIQDTHGENVSADWADNIDEAGKAEMFAMFNYIYEKGVIEVHREINNGEVNILSKVDAAQMEAKNAVIN